MYVFILSLSFTVFFCMTQLYLVHKVTDADVELGKTVLKHVATQSATGCEGTSADIAKQMAQYGRRQSLAEIMTRIDAVTSKDLKAVSFFFVLFHSFIITVDAIISVCCTGWCSVESYIC